MKCTNCGAELVLGEEKCRNCGQSKLPSSSEFIKAEKSFIALQALYQAGRMDQATYTAERQKLQVQDEAGQWWWLGGENGEWYWSDGQQWIRRDPTPAPASVVKPKAPITAGRSWLRWIWILGAVPVIALLLWLVAGAVMRVISLIKPTPTQDEVAVAEEKTAQPTVVEEIAITATPMTVDLSDQQQLLVDEFGWPDSFTILEVDDDQGQKVRFETWTYYAGKIIYTFFDGVFQVEGYIDPIDEEAIISPYRPDQFALGATPEQIGALITSGDFTRIPDEGSGLEGVDLYVADQLVVGFEEDRLVYVDALVFLPEGGE